LSRGTTSLCGCFRASRIFITPPRRFAAHR
jgi:hypothetical protein